MNDVGDKEKDRKINGQVLQLLTLYSEKNKLYKLPVANTDTQKPEIKV